MSSFHVSSFMYQKLGVGATDAKVLAVERITLVTSDLFAKFSTRDRVLRSRNDGKKTKKKYNSALHLQFFLDVDDHYSDYCTFL